MQFLDGAWRGAEVDLDRLNALLPGSLEVCADVVEEDDLVSGQTELLEQVVVDSRVWLPHANVDRADDAVEQWVYQAVY